MPDGLPRFHGLDRTTITNDINLVLHLLALYFCWEYPIFASLSKEHFLRDFRDRQHRYYSPLLINALLALGCRFSTHPVTRANSKDSHSAGDHFFKESQRLFDQETDHHSLTTIQALGIMSIREASCGRDSKSRYYMGLHYAHDEGDQDELSVKLATFWGAFSLDHVYSLVTGSLPQCSSFPHLPSKPLIIKDIEAKLWVPYTDDGVPLQLPCEQQSNERSVYKCFCELKYLSWYDTMPDVLRLGYNFSPAVLFTHMYYHFAILLLFWPLIKLRIIGSQVSPRVVCLEAVNAIQDLLTSYSRLYTLKRAPSFMPCFALTSSIMQLIIMATMTFQQGIAKLAEMAPCHHIAEQALHILYYLAKEWNINVDVDTGAALKPEKYERAFRSLAGNLSAFMPIAIVDDSISHRGTGEEAGERTLRQLEKPAESMEDLLLWPFLMQRRSILSKGKELEEAGFAVL
ncbi:hypothetical protein DER45DRAFT_588450 [Fusarium avenaceum]|nr:hypothetical protein DER45DRAFT_588450 [Fusarium avenaceum]